MWPIAKNSETNNISSTIISNIIISSMIISSIISSSTIISSIVISNIIADFQKGKKAGRNNSINGLKLTVWVKISNPLNKIKLLVQYNLRVCQIFLHSLFQTLIMKTAGIGHTSTVMNEEKLQPYSSKSDKFFLSITGRT